MKMNVYPRFSGYILQTMDEGEGEESWVVAVKISHFKTALDSKRNLYMFAYHFPICVRVMVPFFTAPTTIVIP
jgi:hypothetical protein